MALRDTLLARQAAREAAAEAKRRRKVELEAWAAIVSTTLIEIQNSLAPYVRRDLLTVGLFRGGLAIADHEVQIELTAGTEPRSDLVLTGVAGCTGSRRIVFQDDPAQVWRFEDGTPLGPETFEAALDEMITGRGSNTRSGIKFVGWSEGLDRLS